MIINISITDKRPVVHGSPVIVCNNKGSYTIQFTFDAEWDAHSKKVVRFVYVQRGEKKLHDVEMTGTTCTVPALSDTNKVQVGVFAGDICTTTPAVIPCERSILCEDAEPSVENDKYYANDARKSADRAEAAAKAAAESETGAEQAANRAETAKETAEGYSKSMMMQVQMATNQAASAGEAATRAETAAESAETSAEKAETAANEIKDVEWLATSEKRGGSVELECEIAFTNKYASLPAQYIIDEGFIDFDVYWNGVKYPCTLITGEGEAFLGNKRLLGSSYPDTGEPFLFTGFALTGQVPRLVAVQKSTATAETISVAITTREYTEYNKLPDEFLPDSVVKSVNGVTPDENGNVEVEGGADIDVTATVGQTIIVKEVDENGKPTKWESADYQPRTHWSEVVTELPETQLVDTGEGAFITQAEFALIYGDEYIVTYNGERYECTASKSGEDVFLGNGGPLEMEDNGLPFLSFAKEGMVIVVPLDGATSVTAKIERINNVKIPNKYIEPLAQVIINIVETTDGEYSTNFLAKDARDAFIRNRAIVGSYNKEILTLTYFVNNDNSISMTLVGFPSHGNRVISFELRSEGDLNSPLVVIRHK